MNIYIAGPIAAMPNENAEAFAAAEERLRKLGHRVFNPQRENALIKDKIRRLRKDIAVLAQSDAIYMLEGWDHKSRYAPLEHYIATQLGLKIYYEHSRIPFGDETNQWQKEIGPNTE